MLSFQGCGSDSRSVELARSPPGHSQTLQSPHSQVHPNGARMGGVGLQAGLARRETPRRCTGPGALSYFSWWLRW